MEMQGIERVIFHIGRHKSGTSSVQHFFNQNLNYFDGQGILYPMSGRPKNSVGHHTFALSCFGDIDFQSHTDIVNNILSEIKPHHHTLLISSESFQTLEKPARVSAFLNMFPNADRDIICYFREYVDYMMSSFRQATQNQTRFRTFNQFLSHRYKMPQFFKLWNKLGQMHIRWFHPDLLKGGDIVTDFCDLANISGGKSLKKAQNISIGGNILFLKLAQNHGASNQLSYKNLTDLALTYPQFRRPFFLSKARTDKARQRNVYNKILEKKLGSAPLRYWTDGIALPDVPRFESDLTIVQNMLPEFDGTKARQNLLAAKDWF